MVSLITYLELTYSLAISSFSLLALVFSISTLSRVTGFELFSSRFFLTLEKLSQRHATSLTLSLCGLQVKGRTIAPQILSCSSAWNGCCFLHPRKDGKLSLRSKRLDPTWQPSAVFWFRLRCSNFLGLAERLALPTLHLRSINGFEDKRRTYLVGTSFARIAVSRGGRCLNSEPHGPSERPVPFAIAVSPPDRKSPV